MEFLRVEKLTLEEMFNNKFKLFSISLVAVWIILFIRNVDIPLYFGADYEFVGWRRVLTFGNFIALCSFSMFNVAIFSLIQLRQRLKGSPSGLPLKITKVQNKNYEYINTLATLVTLFSVILVPIGTWREFLVFLVLMAIICICYLKTDLYYCNPIFAVLGYRLYSVYADVSTKLPDNSIGLYFGELEPGRLVRYYHIADDVYYLK